MGEIEKHRYVAVALGAIVAVSGAGSCGLLNYNLYRMDGPAIAACYQEYPHPAQSFDEQSALYDCVAAANGPEDIPRLLTIVAGFGFIALGLSVSLEKENGKKDEN